MNTAYITTVGTSLLTNRDERPWAGWNSQMELPQATRVSEWLKEADPKIACAELNTLSQLAPDETDSIVFLHSDTAEGEFCAQMLLTEAGRRWGSKCTLNKIASLDYRGGKQSSQGLRSLAGLLLKHHREATEQGQIVKFCATGGFKSEIAFSNLIGVFTGSEVLYIHEQFRELVRLPALPIGEDRTFIKENEEFFYWIEKDIRSCNEAQSWLAANPRLEDLVDYDEENVYLNPAALMLFRLYQEEIPIPWPQESMRLPRDKDRISGMSHHRPKGWESIVYKLCSHPYVDAVRYTDYKPGKSIEELDTKTFRVNYRKSGEGMGMLIETTSTTVAQLRRIVTHIERVILRK